MSQQQQLSTQILIHIAQELNLALKSLVATITLFDEGGTVPFIARYRKEVTGNLDEVAIGAIQEKLAGLRHLLGGPSKDLLAHSRNQIVDALDGSLCFFELFP